MFYLYGGGYSMEFSVDFNRDSNLGQMLPKERKALYETILKEKPKKMLEIGTWKGGGSTYFMGSAAKAIGSTLFSIEADINFYTIAVNTYNEELSYLKPFVYLIHGYSENIIPDLLKDNDFDFVLFDGKEDSEQTVLEYNMLNKSLSIGSLIACHDWKTDKMLKLKDIINNDKSWHNIISIQDTITGFTMFKRLI